jgi:hypothetical protein
MKKQFFKSLKPPSSRLLPNVSDYQFNDRISNLTFIVSFILTALNLFLVWVNFSSLPAQVPLFLQRTWGESQLAPKDYLWLQPGILIIFFLINYAISLLTLKNEPLTARILGGALLICSLMSLISIWNIMNLVITIRLWF